MKKLISLFLCLVLLAGILPAFAEGADGAAQALTVQATPLLDENGQIGSLDLRFSADAPNIPYFGFKAYMAVMQETEVTVTSQEDGTWLIAKPDGNALVANPSAGTIYAEDWAAFQTPDLPYIQQKKGIKDTDCSWSEITEIIYDDEPIPVTFDFAKYGIAIYADAEDVYLPLAVLSCMLEDESLNLIAWNGENLYKYSGNMNNLKTFAPGFYAGDKIQALINGQAQRAEDQIRESYAELCFFADYFYGHPGVAAIDAAIEEKGLDAALDDLPDGRGEAIRQALHSPDYIEYLVGINDLISYGLGDGHTSLITISAMTALPNLYAETTNRMIPMITEAMQTAMNLFQYMLQQIIMPTRTQLWGEETYREFGSTAIIRIDIFNPDEAGWHAWKEGQAEMPMDALGITCRGLEKAAANPNIKNIIFDLTANGGGSQDLLQAIIGMVTGEVNFRGYNTLTKQHMHSVVRTDRNMDGAIDEKDKDVTFDYHFGVLTSRMAFSCGNLFPYMMQEEGAAVIGENTGGGGCVVQMFTLSDGPVYLMSSYQWRLTDKDGGSVEGGADPDLPIERIENNNYENPYFPRLTPGDYSPFYNDELLDQLMNEWFAEELAPAA